MKCRVFIMEYDDEEAFGADQLRDVMPCIDHDEDDWDDDDWDWHDYRPAPGPVEAILAAVVEGAGFILRLVSGTAFFVIGIVLGIILAT